MPDTLKTVRPHRRAAAAACAAAAALVMAACGGGENPFDNPADIENAQQVSGKKLSFAYFQKCINPIFLAQLRSNGGGATGINTCASSGCHDNVNGTGGALRIVPGAQPMDLADPANTADRIRQSDMYKNFYSAQGSSIVGSPSQSRLLTKPLLLNVLHGGGLIFESDQDPNARLIAYWITHPVPQGSDEFAAANGLFTPPDAATGACNTQ
jgi:hypothetical protein